MPETSQRAVEPLSKTTRSTLLVLGVIFLVYILALFAGLPQKWTNSQFAHFQDEKAASVMGETGGNLADVAEAPENADAANEDALAASADKASETAASVQAYEASVKDKKLRCPPLWTALPFVTLLLCIAILPLLRATDHWWESNLNRFIVVAFLALSTIAYYAFFYQHRLDLHWPSHSLVSPDEGWFLKGSAVFVNAILGEYVSFIVLLFALFSITGGIRIAGDWKASSLHNSIILAAGAIMASFVGTTGAAMLLIRFLLETNKHRKHKTHTVIFFIFCVCNVGGCLLPTGDPPLFLGYLRGVKFLWTLSLWKEWLFVCGTLIVLYYLLDTFYYYPREFPLDRTVEKFKIKQAKISGLYPNLFCLFGVILAVMLLDPTQEFLSLFGVKTGWYPPMFLREIVQLLMVFLSFALGSETVRKLNEFNFGAIIEVAVLFFGIFICMQAPLQILDAKGADIVAQVNKYGSKLKLNEAKEFFWMSGTLSSMLDNAPTYLVFYETAKSASEGKLQKARAENDLETAAKIEAELQEGVEKTGVAIPVQLLVAVSLGSVFLGAMTYIGNGPNFMVKACAEQAGVKMPTFFGYMGYSIGFLLPILIAMTIIFL